MKRNLVTVTVTVTVIAAVLVAGVFFGLGFRSPVEPSRDSGDSPPDRRDFMFQVAGYETENQGGQTMNLYFHYRYNQGIADKDIPNYIDLRTEALDYLDDVDAASNPYWETLAKAVCTELSSGFPIEAISCQMQVLPDGRKGLPYEPGYHATVYTIGDIEPLALAGPLDTP